MDQSLDFIPVEPPVANSDGSYTVRGRMTAPGWQAYRYAPRAGISRGVKAALKRIPFVAGKTFLHASEAERLGETVMRHLEPCDPAVQEFTLRFDGQMLRVHK